MFFGIRRRQEYRWLSLYNPPLSAYLLELFIILCTKVSLWHEFFFEFHRWLTFEITGFSEAKHGSFWNIFVISTFLLIRFTSIKTNSFSHITNLRRFIIAGSLQTKLKPFIKILLHPGGYRHKKQRLQATKKRSFKKSLFQHFIEFWP